MTKIPFKILTHTFFLSIHFHILLVNCTGNGIKVPDFSRVPLSTQGKFPSSNGSIFEINYASRGHGVRIKKSDSDLTSNGIFVVAGDKVKSLRMNCSSSFCPVEWQLEKFQYASFPADFSTALEFENEREAPDFWNASSYVYRANLRLQSASSQLTGNYSCGCAQEPDVKFWVYVFWQGSTSAFLLQDGNNNKEILVYRPKEGNPNSNWVSFHCGVSSPTKKVYLHKVLQDDSSLISFKQEGAKGNADSKSKRHRTRKVEVDGVAVTQDVDEFHLNLDNFPNPYGHYFCSLKNTIEGVHRQNDQNVAFIEISNETEKTLPQYHLSHTWNLWEESRHSVEYDLDLRKISCCKQRPSNSSVHQVGFYCDNPSTCKLFTNRFSDPSNAKHEDGENCDSYTLDFKPTDGAVAFRCTNEDTQSQAEYFFSRQGNPIFSFDDAKPENLIELQLLPLKNETRIENGEASESSEKLVYYSGSPLEFRCESSTYYFARGIRWLIQKFKSKSNATSSFHSTVVNFDLTVEEMRREGYEATLLNQEKLGDNRHLKIRIFDTEFNSISCLAPIWNSSEWFNASLRLNFSAETREIKILEGETEISVAPTPGKALNLMCSATGEPLPEFKWLKNDVEIKMTKTRSNGTVFETVERTQPTKSNNQANFLVKTTLSLLKFEPGLHRGKYTCEASNSATLEPKRRVFNVELEAGGISGLVLGITIGVIALLLILLTLCARILIVQKRKIRILTEEDIYEFERGNPTALEQLQGKNKDINSQAQLLPYNSDYEVPRETLVTDESFVLGEGEFGLVIKGTLIKNAKTHQVAVKMVKHQNQDVQNFKILLAELKIMAFIGHHENIVSLVGAYSRNIRNKELLVAVEFCENGSLHDLLKQCRPHFKKNAMEKSKNPVMLYQNEPQTVSFLHGFRQSREQNIVRKKLHEEMTIENLYRWSEQVANGMTFLSSKNVIHSDLATRNILIAGDLTAKIGDFGLSKFLFEYSTYVKTTTSPLPWRWISLEGLRDMEFSVQSDIWSFGVVIWEIFSLARVPYPGMVWDTDFMEKLENNYRLERPEFASEKMYEIMLKCWARDPEDRPSFLQLALSIQNLHTDGRP